MEGRVDGNDEGEVRAFGGNTGGGSLTIRNIAENCAHVAVFASFFFWSLEKERPSQKKYFLD